MNVATTRYSYTSLKDMMHKKSKMNLNEITLKNELLKQAAMAYLGPLSNLTEYNFDNKGFFNKLFRCGSGSAVAESGCFHWFICCRRSKEDKQE